MVYKLWWKNSATSDKGKFMEFVGIRGHMGEGGRALVGKVGR